MILTDPNDSNAWKSGSFGKNCTYRVQPSVVRPKEGNPTLLAFYRDRKAEYIYTSTSKDDGKSWDGCYRTSLPNNNAGIEAFAMRSGSLVMVYNPMRSGRNHLVLSLSTDAGKTWKYTRTLEQAKHKNEFSYPTLREDVIKDGVIHVSYTYKRDTIKYSRVTEDWIRKGDKIQEEIRMQQV